MRGEEILSGAQRIHNPQVSLCGNTLDKFSHRYFIILVYWSRFLLLWTSTQTNKQTNLQIFIPQSFGAKASSSGGIQTLIVVLATASPFKAAN